MAVLVLALAACGGGSSSARPPRTIVIDRSIAGISLLEKRRAVERTLGSGVVLKVSDQRAPEPQAHAEEVGYPKFGLEVAYVSKTKADRQEGRAITVVAFSPDYRTNQGVHVGSTLAQVRAIPGIKCFNGGFDCQHGNVHNKPGTGFALRNGKVWRIVITILD